CAHDRQSENNKGHRQRAAIAFCAVDRYRSARGTNHYGRQIRRSHYQEERSMKTRNDIRRAMLGVMIALAMGGGMTAATAQNRTFSFAYDQPNTTAYGIAANIFDAKLKELSKGTMSI